LIKNGDVVITYAWSYAIEMLFTKAHKKLEEKGQSFKLIVVDNPPEYNGRELVRKLSLNGINCVYTNLNGIAFFMRKASKIFVSACSMLSNGNCIAKVGTAMLGCIAKQYRVPFIVLCESYKFSERSQLDSISQNECIFS